MRLSNYVTEDDVEEAVQLVKQATLNSATDPSTGIVDMGMLSTGISSRIAARIKEISVIIK
jgi:DNA replication licensing factor MCM4